MKGTMMDATAQATARMSLAATGFPPPLSTEVPWKIRLLGVALGRTWREGQEAAFVRSMELMRLSSRAPMEREVNPFETQVWTAPMTVTADRLGAGDVIDCEDQSFTLVSVELSRTTVMVETVEVPGYVLVLRRERPVTVLGHVCQL
jgi:hypothetical protein